MRNESAQVALDWQKIDADYYLHPFSDLKKVKREGVQIIDRAEGCYVWDSDGNRYLDGMSGICNVQIGYGREEMAAVAAEQIKTLSYYNCVFNTSNRPAAQLAEKLVKLTPQGLNHVIYTQSGSEANDSGVRLGRYYWQLLGRPEKRAVIALEHGYHGSTMASAYLSGNPILHAQGAELSDCYHIKAPSQFDYLRETGRDMSEEAFGRLAAGWLEEKILHLGAENVGMFWAEPMQSFGGAKMPPRNYWPEVVAICRKYEVLIGLDEVVTGFGRSGEWFAADYFGIEEVDFMALAKGLSSGYAAIGALMVSDRVAQCMIDKVSPAFFFGYTNSGHPVSCALALENIRILEEEGIVDRVRETLAPLLAQQLKRLCGHPLVAEVRSCGMLAAVELARGKEPLEFFERGTVGARIRDYALRHGVIVRPRDETIITLPLLVSTEQQLVELVDGIENALNDLYRDLQAEGML